MALSLLYEQFQFLQSGKVRVLQSNILDLQKGRVASLGKCTFSDKKWSFITHTTVFTIIKSFFHFFTFASCAWLVLGLLPVEASCLPLFLVFLRKGNPTISMPT